MPAQAPALQPTAQPDCPDPTASIPVHVTTSTEPLPHALHHKTGCNSNKPATHTASAGWPLAALLQALAAIDPELRGALSALERDVSGRVSQTSVARVRAALDAAAPDVAVAAATIAGHLRKSSGQGAQPVVPPPAPDGVGPVSPFSHAALAAPHSWALGASAADGGRGSASVGGRASPASSSSGSVPARKLSSIGLALSVDVSAASDDSAEASDEDESEGCDEVTSTETGAPNGGSQPSELPASDEPASGAGGAAVVRSRLLAKRPPTPATGLGLPVPDLPAPRLHHAAAAPSAVWQQQPQEPLPARGGKGAKAALLREGLADKLANRPPTPGVQLSAAASIFKAASDAAPGNPGAPQEGSGPRPSRSTAAAGAAAGSHGSSGGGGSRSSSRESSHGREARRVTWGDQPRPPRRVTFEDEEANAKLRAGAGARACAPGALRRHTTAFDEGRPGRAQRRPPTPGIELRRERQSPSERSASCGVDTATASLRRQPLPQHKHSGGGGDGASGPTNGSGSVAAKLGSVALNAEVSEAKGGLRPPTPGAALVTRPNIFATAPPPASGVLNPRVASDGSGDGGFGAWLAHAPADVSAPSAGGGSRSGAAGGVLELERPPPPARVLAAHNPDLQTDHTEGSCCTGAAANTGGGGSGSGKSAGRSNRGGSAKGNRPPTPGFVTVGRFNTFADGSDGGDNSRASRAEALPSAQSAPGGVTARQPLGVPVAHPRSISPDLMAQQSTPAAAAGSIVCGNAGRTGSASSLHSVTAAAHAAAAEAEAHTSPLQRCSSAADPEPARSSPLRFVSSASGAAEADAQTDAGAGGDGFSPAVASPLPAANAAWAASAVPVGHNPTQGPTGGAQVPPLFKAASLPSPAQLSKSATAAPAITPLQRASSTGNGAGPSAVLAPGRLCRSSSPCDAEPGRGSKLRHASPSLGGGVANAGIGAPDTIGRG